MTLREHAARLIKPFDGTDVVIVTGSALLWYGANQIVSGLGPALVGVILLALASAPRLKR